MGAKGQRKKLQGVDCTTTQLPLISSLAQELSQPLAAIASNSRAAYRFLEQAAPDVAEARAALQEILGDSERARLLVEQMRAALALRPPQLGPLQLNDLVADLVQLLGGRASTRNIAVDQQLAPEMPLVAADREQLQQIVHHLLATALDAVVQSSVQDRRVTLRTARHDESRAELVITGALEPAGLTPWAGVIAAHDGRLNYERGPAGEARVRLTVPFWRGDRS